MELVKSVGHPAELWALIKYKFLGGKNVVIPKVDYSTLSSGMKRCYQLLNQTSRSFSAVIQSLDDDLRPAVVIFYLVLRALDTVEDDMTIPLREKIPMLQQFHKYLQLAEWRYMDSQEKDKAVLEEFPFISGEFRALKPVFQDVISDITRQMGSGMCVFLEKEVDSMDQWDEYCHYVAGLVGIGLTKLFMASGLEKGMEQEEEEEAASRRQGSSNGDHNSSVVLGLSNSMGLFLQKTNIIRDYLEDSLQDREFWPKDAWGQFVSELKDFQQPERRREAVQCLNLLITNALGQLPDVLQYMSRIHNQSIFNFCAIPQTMAIATLALCYNNPEVFTGVVKIRKGVAVALIMGSTNMDNLKAIFAQFAEEIASKVDPSDPSSAETIAITRRVMDLCSDTHPYSGTKQSPLSPSPSSAASKVPLITGATALAAAMATYAYWSGYWTT